MQFETDLKADSGSVHFPDNTPMAEMPGKLWPNLASSQASLYWIAWQHCLVFFPFVAPIFRVPSCQVSCFQTQYCAFSCNSLPRHRSQLCWSLPIELATSNHTVTAYLGGTLPSPFSGLAWCYHMLAQPYYSWTWVDGFAWCAQGDHVRLLPWLPWSSSAEAQAPAVVMQASAQWTSVDQLMIMHVICAQLHHRWNWCKCTHMAALYYHYNIIIIILLCMYIIYFILYV